MSKAHVSEGKKKFVKETVDKLVKTQIIGIINLEALPSAQLQNMKKLLRDKIEIVMLKKTIGKIILDEVNKKKPGMDKLKDFLGGNPALLFTKENPFKICKIIKKNKSPAPAKPGQTAPKDIIINAGPTPFTPGPVISELKQLGLNAGIEGGKIVIKNDSVACKQGEKISPQLASMLTRLGIEPMELGLNIVAMYENGVIYDKTVLEIDEERFNKELNTAIMHAQNLSVEIAYPTKQNISILLSKTVRESRALARSQNILAKGIVEEILAKAKAQMLALKNQINV